MAVFDEVLPPSAKPASVFPDAPAHYAFRARLGEGGHGEVYEAWDAKLQRGVAIKRIKQDAIASGADLMREARMAASLHHPAFVKVHAIEEAGAGQFIVMELVPGRTLKQVLAEGKPDPVTALDWIRQVAEAMQDAHASGLVHGDLKPSNLMIEPGGKVRILDFGLALRQDMLETTTVTQSEPQGTIAYMAPERLLGAPPHACGDIYAIGVILYESVVGSRPFPTLNGLALAAAHMQSSSDSWHYPDDLDTPLIALIRAMTAKSAEHRIQTLEEVARRLHQFPNGAPVAAKDQAPPARKLPAYFPRLRTRILFASVSLCFVVAIGSYAWHAMPDWQAVKHAFAPYSETAEMAKGLDALKVYDRPGELERAESHFNMILDHNPENAAAVAGISLTQNLRYTSDSKDEIWLQKSDASAQLALKLNDQLALSHIAVGAVHDRQGQYSKALEAYDKALRLDPANYFAWYGKVESLRNSRQYEKTLSALNEAMRRFPQEPVFLGELGTLKFEQGHFLEAEKAFRRAIALQPDAVTPYASLNGILLAQNRTDEALSVLQQGLQIRPSAVLYSNLGSVLFFRGDYVGAAEAYENAVSPTRGGAGRYIYWANLGDALSWLPGREQQAKNAYAKAKQLLEPLVARSPNDPALLSRMGLYSARAGLTAQAVALSEHALQLAPKDPNVQFRAALAYELLGKRSLAIKAINAAKRSGYPEHLIAGEPGLVALRRDPAYDRN